MAKILLVDDDPIIQKIITAQLKRWQHEVITAGSGTMAVKLANDIMPDIILMDMRLPGMDGSEATAQIKANIATTHIPIVAQTSANSTSEHQELYDAGCSVILVKPVQLAELQAILDELLP